jgi:hypothetical protein
MIITSITINAQNKESENSILWEVTETDFQNLLILPEHFILCAVKILR